MDPRGGGVAIVSQVDDNNRRAAPPIPRGFLNKQPYKPRRKPTVPPAAAKPPSNGRAPEDTGSSGGMGVPRQNGHASGHEQEEEQQPPPPVIPAFTPAGLPDLIAVDTTSMQLQWQPICQLPLTIPLDVSGQPIYDAATIPPCSVDYRLETRTVRCASFPGSQDLAPLL